VLVINDQGRVTAFKTSPITLASAGTSKKAAAVPAEQAAPPAPKRRGPSASEPIETPAQAPAESSAPAAEPPPRGNGTGG
jgi:hypothetical protein